MHANFETDETIGDSFATDKYHNGEIWENKKIYSVSISITSLFDTVVNLPTVDELSDTCKNRS